MDITRLTLAELAIDGIDVALQCRGCGNNVTASARQMAEHFGADRALQDLNSHLKCPLCGSTDIATAPGAWARHAFPFPKRRRRWH